MEELVSELGRTRPPHLTTDPVYRRALRNSQHLSCGSVAVLVSTGVYVDERRGGLSSSSSLSLSCEDALLETTVQCIIIIIIIIIIIPTGIPHGDVISSSLQ
ncbi:unnamed protein product [Pleuronectes platessa]|uniref:Uncharacterized protein n=1 Tax=Pleuronectes platessa TaxID=8262 RepID=A0A9N7YTX1_PLEPL|nr:unnamed protein product [Pleuronectes platessa]